jgi:hypothetical protein
MTRRRVFAEGIEYDFAPDDAPVVAHRHWAIATAQVRDDIDGVPLRIPFTVRVEVPGEADEIAQDGTRVRRTERAILVKIGPDGTFALVAQPWLRFTPFAVPLGPTVTVQAAGFVPLRHTFALAYDQRTIVLPLPSVGGRTVTLNSTAGLAAGQTLLFGPANQPQYVRIANVGAGGQVTLMAGLTEPHVLGETVFPDSFATPPTAVLGLRRTPVRIVGRVVARNTAANTSTAVANALVEVSDFWRTRAAIIANPAHGSMTHPVPAQRQFAVAVSPGTLATRAVGAAAGTVVLPLVSGDDRLLARPAVAERPRIEVGSWQNLQPPPAPLANRLLLIAPGDAAVAEYHTVAAVEPVGAVEEPARLTLDLPLRGAHAAATRVSRINAPAVLPPTPRALKDGAEPGDRCVFLDALATLPAVGTMRLTGGGAPDEFQRCERLSTASNVNGDFRLPPVQRVARLALKIDDGAGHIQTIEVDPTYGEPEQRVDVVYFA